MALRLAGIAALLPFFATHRALLAQSLAPFGPMRFTRRLRRDLPDGQAIDVVRSFHIRFTRTDAGFLVEGDQIGAQVDAPPALAPLARIEQDRIETTLFPMYLDASGLIVAGPTGQIPADMGEAFGEALGMIAQSGLSSRAQVSAREFVLGLQLVANRIASLAPPQLFTGLREAWTDERDLPLPDGQRGTVSVRFTHTAHPASGLLDHAERRVITRIGGAERHTLEEWSLSPMESAGR